MKEKLDAERDRQEQSKLVFEVRSRMKDILWQAKLLLDRIDVIAQSTNFAGVDQEIKQVGVALRSDVQDLVNAMTSTQQKRDFLEWEDA